MKRAPKGFGLSNPPPLACGGDGAGRGEAGLRESSGLQFGGAANRRRQADLQGQAPQGGEMHES